MSKRFSFAVWAFEIFGEALGTTLWMLVLPLLLLEADSGYSHSLLDELPGLIGIGAVVFIEFALTGYLLTTLLVALYLPRKLWFLYPYICCGLYLIHSEVFFLGLGNRVLDKHDLTLQIGGACFAFALTLFGYRVRRSHQLTVETAPD